MLLIVFDNFENRICIFSGAIFLYLECQNIRNYCFFLGIILREILEIKFIEDAGCYINLQHVSIIKLIYKLN